MIPKQDRVHSRKPTDLEYKYRFGELSETNGIANDAHRQARDAQQQAENALRIANEAAENSVTKEYVDGRTVDYIVEQGIGNYSWYYRKWANGTYECWKIIEGSDACTTEWGSVYSTNPSNYYGSSGYPITFVEPPTVSVTPYFVDYAYWVAPVYAGTNARAQGFRFVSPVSLASISFKVSVYAIGRWK